MIIAGDIGGTKTNVALFEARGRELGRIVVQQSFPSGGYNSLEAILADFVAAHKPDAITGACFGVAGPVVRGRVEATNLAWKVSDESLARSLNLPSVHLINDLEATAFGLDELRPEQLYTLNEGEADPSGHRALIAAGTGLGMAGLFNDGRRFVPMPSEGGHVDFAPRNEREFEMLTYLCEKVGGRVSYERVLSGLGLFNIYTFLRDRGHGEEPAWLAEEIENGDPTAVVARAGLGGRCGLAATTLQMFVEIYGAMAGNLALLMKSTGGLYVGGGIAPKILPALQNGRFMKAFRATGCMSELVSKVPVKVILNPEAGLLGAAVAAQEL